MKKILIGYLIFFLLVIIVSCNSDDEDGSASASFSCGVLSSSVESYSENELTLKVKFFVLDHEESDQLTTKNLENSLTYHSLYTLGTLVDIHEVTTPSYGNFSCAVLLDEYYSMINYDFFSGKGSTDSFLRKFFKKSGIGNSFMLSSFHINPETLTFYGKGFTSNPAELDLPMARLFGEASELNEKVKKLPLLQNINILLDSINKNAPEDNKNLLIFSSRASYITSGNDKDSIISKARQFGIKVSAILDRGGEYYIDYDLDNEDLYYKIAEQTGGFVYTNNQYISNSDGLILASCLGNIMKGDFKCFEAKWRIMPNSWADTFKYGYYSDAELDIELSLDNMIEIPMCIYIK